MPRRKTETQADRKARRQRWLDGQACWARFARKFLVEKQNFLFDRDGDGKIFTPKTMGEVIDGYSSLQKITKEAELVEKARARYSRGNSDAAKLVFAHAFFAYKLITRSKYGDNKKRLIKRFNLGEFVKSPNDPTKPLYWNGVAGVGRAYKKCGESVGYVLGMFKELARQQNLNSVAAVNKAIRKHCEDGYNSQPPAVRWAANAFLWYVADDAYEPILAQTHKKAISTCPDFVKLIEDNPAYLSEMAKNEFKQNKVIALIRKEYVPKDKRDWFSFYDTDVEIIWRKD